MSKTEPSFFEKTINPIKQGIAILSLMALIMIVVKIIYWANIAQISGQAFWIVAGAGILLFALFNSVLSLSAVDMNLYWTRSIPTYAALMIASGLLAFIFSSMSMQEAGSFRWIFMVLTFGYLLFLSLMRFLRKIVQIAQKEDDRWMKRMK